MASITSRMALVVTYGIYCAHSTPAHQHCDCQSCNKPVPLDQRQNSSGTNGSFHPSQFVCRTGHTSQTGRLYSHNLSR
ncbi:hypothetical protein BpHYR1_013501 [Brachionus plicatilis]|uniref:Uncharacterized protein n=1 Tax=Brachionus plicatilis TaxID=10195 RepID=A0A3M7RWJ6_BRAPC|nr:hypothetical protein BpHYR1_013501 [Brachionus plicatilis]